MSDVELAAELLKKDKVVIFPTESSYGMGAKISSASAIRKVFQLKGRPLGKALPVIVYDLEQMKKFGVITPDAEKLSAKFHPGPLTLVVDATDAVPSSLSEESIAFRISSHAIAHTLCGLVGEPITATSANLAGEPPIYDSDEARRQFTNVFVVEGGKLKQSPPSTIFDVRTRKLLREGPISEKEILAALD